MAKVIANRMKPLLGEVISETQSMFVPGRLITYNILVASEVGHFLRRKQCGKQGWAALKLDMAKAYDRMEWNFLHMMMLGLGFDPRWVRLIMMCVTSVKYNILIEGSITNQIIPTRGIRQDDPLYPILFIICAEGLSVILYDAENKRDLHGIRVA